jgi:hypothetical protein
MMCPADLMATADGRAALDHILRDMDSPSLDVRSYVGVVWDACRALVDDEMLCTLISLQCKAMGYQVHIPIDCNDFPPDDAMCYITYGWIDGMISVFFQKVSPTLRYKELHMTPPQARRALAALRTAQAHDHETIETILNSCANDGNADV